MEEIRKRFIREFEIEEGSGKLHPGVNLNFMIDYETVEISVEPIKLNGSGIVFSRGDIKLWVNEVMADKGFTKKIPKSGLQPLLPYPPYQYNVAAYADYLRNTHGTDWATVIFFYDNSDDEDGHFANKRSAGPPMGVGGPGLHFSNNRGRPFIMRKKKRGGPASITGIIHEFLHVWYAVDEHTKNRHFKEDAVIGYLGGPNLNYNKAMGFKCVMYRGPHWPNICPYTKKHIGWTDNDGNHIPDILDIKPTIALSSTSENGSTKIYKGSSFSPPLPNRNPYSEGGTIKPPHDLSVVLHLAPVPEKRLGIRKLFKKAPAFNPPFPWTRNDISLNKIILVEYRILQKKKAMTEWILAKPFDNVFDEAVENFIITLKSFNYGTYSLEVRSRNSVHLYSDIVRKQFKN